MGVYVAYGPDPVRRGDVATNVAYGGPDMETLYITEVGSATVQVADLDVPGVRMHSHHG